MTTPLPLSVIIVARNEAHNLPRCLASVRGWAAEAVVALNECSDGSAEAAAAGGARVEHLAWQGFRDTKNAAPRAGRRSPGSCRSTPTRRSRRNCARPSPPSSPAADHDRFAGARFPRQVWFIDRWIRHGDWYPDYSLRLVRRDAARWGGDAVVHEKIICEGPVATLAGPLRHHSFPTLARHVAKINAFADLYVQQQRVRGRRFSAGAAVSRPLWRFFRAYVLRRGFLDGYPGFYIAWANAFGVLVRQSRLYEEEHGRPAPTV